MRIVHESTLHELEHGNCFVTLTYRDPEECTVEQYKAGHHVPADWSLHKSHFQKFMKRLRKRFPQKIRFYHCGEYGQTCRHGIRLDAVDCPMCNVGRPHYHACLFNVSFPDLEPYGSAEDGSLRYTSPMLESIWQYGFVDVGALNYETANYVARYVLKKVTGPKADDWYSSIHEETGELGWLQPEYVTMSRKPGIGKDWYDMYKDDVFPSDEVPVPGKGVIKGVPRYYENIFKEEAPQSFEDVKRLRQVFRKEHGEDYSPERLMDAYKVRKASVKLFSGKEKL